MVLRSTYNLWCISWKCSMFMGKLQGNGHKANAWYGGELVYWVIIHNMGMGLHKWYYWGTLRFGVHQWWTLFGFRANAPKIFNTKILLTWAVNTLTNSNVHRNMRHEFSTYGVKMNTFWVHEVKVKFDLWWFFSWLCTNFF